MNIFEFYTEEIDALITACKLLDYTVDFDEDSTMSRYDFNSRGKNSITLYYDKSTGQLAYFDMKIKRDITIVDYPNEEHFLQCFEFVKRAI